MGIERLGPDVQYFWKIRQWLRNRRARKVLGFFGKGSEWRSGAYAACTSQIFIGENVIIRGGTVLFADDNSCIHIGNNVLMGMGVHIYTNNHVQGSPNEYTYGTVAILNRAWIGANATILKGVTVGEDAIVGAGSVVTKSVPDGEVWAGNPARKIKGKQETTDVRGEENTLYYSRKRRERGSEEQEHTDVQRASTDSLGLRRRKR